MLRMLFVTLKYLQTRRQKIFQFRVARIGNENRLERIVDRLVVSDFVVSVGLISGREPTLLSHQRPQGDVFKRRGRPDGIRAPFTPIFTRSLAGRRGRTGIEWKRSGRRFSRRLGTLSERTASTRSPIHEQFISGV